MNKAQGQKTRVSRTDAQKGSKSRGDSYGYMLPKENLEMEKKGRKEGGKRRC